ncbi:terminase gpA endonuclease subunit [Microvirga arsenatis]|uniref:Terminase n=1 Tax=Microvirga arsenatis TaxID=2692265 RepID=A0ABW9YXN7_9HYPH|nr:terminase gpA endonuclease subunit [Microvirga arsenatis]NBJ13213.1 terminase [Microvirga arsenatis]NBJ25149.1 terminase [Microvirga arsenatis]
MSGHPSALRLLAERLAESIRPPRPMPLSQWLAENLELVDGPLAGELWDPAGAPYLVEIADCLSEDHPCNLVTVRKSQQTGASILALGWTLYVSEREPANLLYGVPGIDALRDLNSGKLQPLIDAWQKRTNRQVIVPQTSRSGTGSTTYEKVFPGGRIWLANANTVMDLSSKTAKKGVKDELSKWQDIPGFGDPETLFFGRFTAFRRTKSYKILEISTPEIDTGDELGEMPGHCRIDRSFKRSDQRYWNLTCPECQRLFVHSFERFKVNEKQPHKSVYVHSCGHEISEAERVAGVKAGRWIPMLDDPDRHPGFHIDAFISLMMSYEAIAEDWIKAQKSESAKKDFYNLNLGLPFKFTGNAPDHVKLMERREEGMKRGHVPPRGLILVASADVQMRGIWVMVTAYASNRERWVVEALYLDGDTSTPDGEAFQKLRQQVLERKYPDAFGRLRTIDALGIDSGYRTHVVYAWVRNTQRPHPDTGRDLILALKGDEGWGKPAIGQPVLVDIDLDGRKVKQGCKKWGVGTWPLKGSYYADLHKEGVKSGKLTDPDGYCHFGTWQDEEFFKQLTAEGLEDIIVKGRVTGRRWVPLRPDNHFFDCAVYNDALAEYLGLSTMTPEEWAALARARGLPDELLKVDLFTPTRSVATEQEPPGAPAPPAHDQTPSAEPESSWFDDRTDDWMGRR